MNALKPLLVSLFLLVFVPFFASASSSDTTVSKLDIYYESGDHTLSAEVIGELAVFLKTVHKPLLYTIEIFGYTDSIGSVKYNQKLANARSLELKRVLTESGIKPELISTYGLGEMNQNNRSQMWKHRTSQLVITQVDYLGQFKADKQTFRIDPSKLTVLNGIDGTKVIIPANSLRKKNGSPVFGAVDIELYEYYTKSDFVLNSLHTSANNMPIESGGTVNLRATQNGNDLILRDGAELKLRFPTNNPVEGMEAFFGTEHDSTHALQDWVANNNLGLVEASSVVVDFNKAEELLSKTAMNLNLEPSEREFLTFFGEPGNENELGILIGNALRKKDQNQLQNLVNLFELDLITAGKEFFSDSLASFKVEGRPFRGSGIVYRKSTKRKINLDEETFAKFNFADADGVKFDYNNSTHVVSLTADNLDFSHPRTVQNYFMTVSQLGWINCDRFMRERNMTLTELVVEIDPALYETINLFLVFKNINSVMPGHAFSDGRVIFHNVPIGMDATIFGHTVIDNELATVIKEIKIGTLPVEAQLEATTEADFKASLAYMDM